MCGIAGIAGKGWHPAQLGSMADAQVHRGPDARGTFLDETAGIGLACNRLSIIDLSLSGHQPMSTPDGSLHLVLNGEIYNYLELKPQLQDYPFRGQSDTEVFLAAFERWGVDCLRRVVGMFAFAIWDSRAKRLICGRDRFGVKPLYYWQDTESGRCIFASEIKAFGAAGVALVPDTEAWCQFLAFGLQDHSPRTAYLDIWSLPAGHTLTWEGGRLRIERWYDLPSVVLARFPDERSELDVEEEYLDLLEQSVRLRFRSDVPVGINLSGGLDSSLLFALVRRLHGPDSTTEVFTFSTGDPRYDETPLVRALLQGTRHPLHDCRLALEATPALLREVARAEDEPFGGIPSVAYGELFAAAQRSSVRVLLDGQGMDEQWGGYDYHAASGSGDVALQGSRRQPTRPDLLATALFDARRHTPDRFPAWSGHRLLDLRLREILHTKLPRALRFNDRVSMMHSCELREPFLDHRLVELALSQPDHHVIRGEEHKVLLRQVSTRLVSDAARTSPKRPVQTPQREWLGGALSAWVRATVNRSALYREWFRAGAIEDALLELREGRTDNSFAVWQMLSLSLWEPLLAPSPK